MMDDSWLNQTAERFWAHAGGLEPFPRSLEQPVLWSLPVAIVKLPRLAVRDVRSWLEERGIRFTMQFSQRRLHGCLVAYKGRACIFLDGFDLEEERRFTLAHEVAHFILDYLEPRERAAAKLGASIFDVFDGLRPATREERIDASLSQVSIGVHIHMMARQSDGSLGCGSASYAEHCADRLALELLAPASEVRQRVRPLRTESPEEVVQAILRALVDDFGLPTSVADDYAHLLARSSIKPSVRKWLGLS
jgi:hypothetical protein